MLMCVCCFGLVVSTCQVIGYRKTPLMTPSWGEEITSTKPRRKRVFVCIFLLFGLTMLLFVPPGPTQYIFHTSMTWYSLFVPKVPLNTNKPDQTYNELYYAMMLCLSLVPYVRNWKLVETDYHFLAERSKVKVTQAHWIFKSATDRWRDWRMDGWMDRTGITVSCSACTACGRAIKTRTWYSLFVNLTFQFIINSNLLRYLQCFCTGVWTTGMASSL